MERSEACASCGACAGLGGRMRLDLPAIDGLRPGQQVIVAINRGTSLVSVFFLFGLPMAGLVAGVILGQALPVFGISRDACSALFGVGLVAAAFVAALVYDRKVATKSLHQPRILRIQPE